MKMKSLMIPFFSFVSCTALLATDYSYSFLRPDKPVHIDTTFRQISKTKFSKYWGPFGYKDWDTSAYLSHFFNKTNSLCLELGYSRFDFDWVGPVFSEQKTYQYFNTSLGWICDAIPKWHLTFNTGFSVDLDHSDAVYTNLIWGRYAYSQQFGLHVGGWVIKNIDHVHTLPILGFDWYVSQNWQLNAVFPADISAKYYINDYLHSSLALSSIGGPYRYPRRTKKVGILLYDRDFSLTSNVVEWNFTYQENQRFLPKNSLNPFKIFVGFGYQFDGKLRIRGENQRKLDCLIDPSVYVQAGLSHSF